MSEPSPESSGLGRPLSARIAGAAKRFLAELVVVFLGVYGAFWVDGYRDRVARERGEHPPPFVFRVNAAEKPPTTTWQVIQQAELPGLLDSNLLYEPGFFYNELSGFGDRVTRYTAFAETEVLPLMKGDSRQFYSRDGGALLPRFTAHIDRLRELRQFWQGSIDWAGCILQRIESLPAGTAPCMPDFLVTPLQ